MTTYCLPLSVSLLAFFVYLQTLTPTLVPALSTDPPISNPSSSSTALRPKSDDNSSHFLQDVLRAICSKRGWDLGDVRVSKLDAGDDSTRFGNSHKYEFSVPIGESRLVLRFWDKDIRWKKAPPAPRRTRRRRADFGSLIGGIGSSAVLDAFRIQGPFELSVVDNQRDELLLLLLPLNSTYAGLKRILVGEGITLEVRRAQQISLFHSTDFGFPVNTSVVINKQGSGSWPLWDLFCPPLPSIKILGSASLVAYGMQNPDSHIKSTLLSKETIELLGEKCYTGHTYKKQACPVDFMRSRIALLEKLLRSLLGNRIHRSGSTFVKAQAKASTVVHFELEVERAIRSNDTNYSTMAEWRTRPSVERVWFEVIARIEAEQLKPLVVKKLETFSEADTVAWSNLLSNISFTKFPSILVPPEALTLDVKW